MSRGAKEWVRHGSVIKHSAIYAFGAACALFFSACLSLGRDAAHEAVRDRLEAGEVRVYVVPGLGKFYLETKKDLVQNVLKSGQIWEGYYRAIFERYVVRGTNVVDAGAFVGSHTVALARLASPGKVYAFEPQRDIYALLKANAAINDLPNVVSFPTALGDVACRTTLMDLPSRVWNKGANPVLGCVTSNQGADLIEMKTLDSYGLENVSFMKIDVEASEKILLEGARRTIRENKPVMLIEISSGYVNDRFTHHRGSSKEVTIPLLKEMGYRVRHL